MANKYGKTMTTEEAVKEYQRQIKATESGANAKKQRAAIDAQYPGLYKKYKNPLPKIENYIKGKK